MKNIEKKDNIKKTLEVRNLRTSFFMPAGEVKAVDDVSYSVYEGETIALVGESGCGKSVSQLSTLQLIQSPPGKIKSGEVIFNGQNLLEYKAKSLEMRAIRGAQISMIFQEPMTSLNPVLTVGSQITEVIRAHKNTSRKESWEIGINALKSVSIPDAAARMKSYPFEMSGGMRQRLMIAISIACGSQLIIADEPTTALDVTTQAQVMELMLGVVRNYNTSMIIVTHNLGLVSRYAKRIYVMYAGKIIESGTTEELLTNPKHPYTIGLLNSVPKLETDKKRLVPISGSPPDLMDLPDRCAFLPRCPYASDICRSSQVPPLISIGGNDHYSACYVKMEDIINEK